ncbi:MAG: outer membrane lipoprotein carrier protein LolA [Thermoanaerobaculia bacterium]|nr:MAG: outer membrane lipoprotein carrier protein LolA [Thermoanaerobaculia bacterium]MBZ0102986.1 outer membrane lipoprotein carrier protein LolA [Thermoanaerobaculia bacterium]
MSRHPLGATLLLLGLVALAAPGRAEDPAPDPWRTLEALRRGLAAGGPLHADFVQTFTPAGFSSGETESGRLSLAMPDCLRWDYVEPFRKSYLICGSRAWSWVESEPRGQRITIDPDRESGLDLLLLGGDELARRYRAVATRRSDGEVDLALEPLDEAAPLVAANLAVTGPDSRPTVLDYRDREGNVTSFRFSDWRPLEADGVFSPPQEVEWNEP